MDTVIFHTMVAPHVQQDALALLESGHLVRFHTSVVDDPRQLWQRWLTRGGKLIGTELEREFSKRRLDPALAPYTETSSWRELLRVAAARLDSSRRLGDAVWEMTEIGFDKAVARKVKRERPAAVLGYEHSSLHTFEAAASYGAKRIYVVPAPHASVVQSMLRDEVQKYPALQDPFQRYIAPKEARRATRRRREWELANLVITASKFTRHSYAESGHDTSNVVVIPLGAPPPVEPNTATAGGSQLTGKLRVLWAGTFGLRKGAHHLLEAWRRAKWGGQAVLDVYGSVTLPREFLGDLGEDIRFHGPVPRIELMQSYESSDVLVFPTLCDGFGMVATEAWSRGLPVITTDRAGVADLIKPDQNGWICRPADPDDLAIALRRCLNERPQLRAMRGPSRETATGWQWSDYRLKLGQAVANLESPR